MLAPPREQQHVVSMDLDSVLQVLLSQTTAAPPSEPLPTESAGDELHSALQILLSDGAPNPQQDAVDLSSVQLLEEVMTDASSSSGSSGSGQSAEKKRQQSAPVLILATATKRPRQTRKPTYYVRKEEKSALELQVRHLQAQLQHLRSENELLASHPQFSSLAHSRSVLLKQAEGEVIRGAVQDQQLSFARMQSAFGKHVSSHQSLPFQSHIHLGKDWIERDATLLGMKDRKLESAQLYHAERTRFLDSGTPFSEVSRFTGDDGDLRSIRFDVIPFDGVQNVRQVFDALLNYFFNMEISVSELLGNITIREEDGVRLQGISQNRLISNVRDDVQSETNSVMFCKLYEASDVTHGGEFGVIVADSVNDDELYPYSPATRLRNDVCAAITLSLQPRKKKSTNKKKTNQLCGEEGGEEEELVVVLTRTCFLNLCRTDLPIPALEMHAIRASFENWGDTMVKTVHDILYPHFGSNSSAVAPGNIVEVVEV